MNELEQGWIFAIEVATDALAAGAGARTLPPNELALRRRRLAIERSWVETVDWPSFESLGATAAVTRDTDGEIAPGLSVPPASSAVGMSASTAKPLRLAARRSSVLSRSADQRQPRRKIAASGGSFSRRQGRLGEPQRGKLVPSRRCRREMERRLR